MLSLDSVQARLTATTMAGPSNKLWSTSIGAALLGGLLFAVGCGAPGLTNEEAEAFCDEVESRAPACVSDASHASCVECHESCGRECLQLESCPMQFTCD